MREIRQTTDQPVGGHLSSDMCCQETQTKIESYDVSTTEKIAVANCVIVMTCKEISRPATEIAIAVSILTSSLDRYVSIDEEHRMQITTHTTRKYIDPSFSMRETSGERHVRGKMSFQVTRTKTKVSSTMLYMRECVR